MASSSSLTVLLLVHVISICITGSYGGSSQRYKAIYSFGDSLADTGNLFYDTTEKLSATHASSLHLPYGETYFHHPTGRCSDGRLIIDFIGSYGGSSQRYRAIYSFGDSIADTGNLFYDTGTLTASHSSSLHLPYGETYFHHPTGRCSNGRLIVDFIAQKMGLSLLKPYLGIKNGKIKDWNQREGVNFAVAGATALNSSFFIERGIFNIATNYSLRVQLDSFLHLLPSICNSSSATDCKKILGSTLFLVGEIGGNDFNYPLFLQKSVEEIKAYIPLVINEISTVIKKLIHVGARTLIVPGNFPIGCNVICLRLFNTTNIKEYDEFGCLKRLNEFAEDYNKKLHEEINRLQKLYQNTNIIYADYYRAALPLYHFPKRYGFTKPIQNSCCAPGVNNGSRCPSACYDPNHYISWDGVHLTEAAYKFIATRIIKWTLLLS